MTPFGDVPPAIPHEATEPGGPILVACVGVGKMRARPHMVVTVWRKILLARVRCTLIGQTAGGIHRDRAGSFSLIVHDGGSNVIRIGAARGAPARRRKSMIANLRNCHQRSPPVAFHVPAPASGPKLTRVIARSVSR